MNIWQAFTGIDEKKGSRVFLTHAGKARETLLALDVKKINCEPVVVYKLSEESLFER